MTHFASESRLPGCGIKPGSAVCKFGTGEMRRSFEQERNQAMASKEIHFEEYLYLAEVTDSAALIAWGGFYFKVSGRDREDGEDWKLIDDDDLGTISPLRRSSIGASAEAYDNGRGSKVEVRRAFDNELVRARETVNANFCWVEGLEPDTEYTYRVFVDGQEWGDGDLRDWEVNGRLKGLRKQRNHYDNRFRTRPSQNVSASLKFAVIGDFGEGVRKSDTHSPAKNDRNRQSRVAKALLKAIDDEGIRLVLTTGDNIYHHRAGTGQEDDDWFFTFYQPYRYVINRVPIYPSCGNHDEAETEASDDRDQLYDNFLVRQRFTGIQGRGAIEQGLFYRVRYGSNIEFISVDTSKKPKFFRLGGDRYFEKDENRVFLETVFPADVGAPLTWRIPFGHHPAFCAGPGHSGNDDVKEKLVRSYFARAGVRVFFCGHEHNFQHSEDGGIDHFISGGGGKVNLRIPTGFDEARTKSWGKGGHFLVVSITDDRMEVRPLGEEGPLAIMDTAGNAVDSRIVLTLS